MEVGTLNKRITLQYATKVSDSMGSFTETWVDAATVWAKAWTVSSSEMTADMQVSMIRIQKFKIRYRRVLRPSWRVKYGTAYYNIISIDPDEKNAFIYLTVEEAA